MKLLAIDTSGDACSAALWIDADIQQRIEHAPRRHGELILTMMQGLLTGADLRLRDLDALAFGRGPGSFTGVRIATSVIQGAAFAADLPVVPVSTLAAMAQGQFRQEGQRRLLTALDARMDEVYWGCYLVGEDDLAALQGKECVCPPERVPPPTGAEWTGAGPGWDAYADALKAVLGDALSETRPAARCEARDVAAIGAGLLARGEQVSAANALPVYLRDRVTYAK
ncbi:tRNA (adenosine(37)-N6)-threonylcarbamoyltransferase complex dimerization subunit type 1 TsaB [Thiocystis violacea]|uniref:tRNA (adenosine(37)-N6)-threonylcarbamoyltransferase complex dimerization subunit type 1 TsaB n=1 Tax=Thiocystis violacea TaxID=13725 RepID=UPI0019058AC3|nr:tRNA (adenosine(37)-N6)-threonylcarbamoyltransferase complex dimerization subunit type 1 TsaB [Thiocystis violacea]MBK1722915.1 tRNA (adenosine(37)-N6)-threonylcarbamoyltransferase complex dimerization subunit type 1 TsaB [Thiocystis violacea]